MQETEARNLIFLLNNISKEDLHSIISELGLYQTIEDLCIKLSNWYVTKKALSEQCAWTVSDNVPLYNINKTGEWNINSDGYYPYCSICGEEPKDGAITDICPNCGADLSKSDQKFKESIDRKWDNAIR